MCAVNKDYLIPIMDAVLSNIVGVQNLAVRIFFLSPLLSDCPVIQVKVLSKGCALRPPACLLVGMASSPAHNTLPYYNIAKLCLIASRPCCIKARWMLNAHSRILPAPINQALFPEITVFACIFFLPGTFQVFVDSH